MHVHVCVVQEWGQGFVVVSTFSASGFTAFRQLHKINVLFFTWSIVTYIYCQEHIERSAALDMLLVLCGVFSL